MKFEEEGVKVGVGDLLLIGFVLGLAVGVLLGRLVWQ